MRPDFKNNIGNLESIIFISVTYLKIVCDGYVVITVALLINFSISKSIKTVVFFKLINKLVIKN